MKNVKKLDSLTAFKVNEEATSGTIGGWRRPKDNTINQLAGCWMFRSYNQYNEYYDCDHSKDL